MDKKEELFKDPRWKEYQPVDVLKTKIKPTKEDEKKIEDFKKFIDKKEEDAKKEK